MSQLVLIVDDESDLLNMLQFNLEREGYRTLTAGTGERGLALALGNPSPDLILLDLMLPDISGTEVCRRVRQHDPTRDTPVLMLTARTDEIDRVVGFEVGADDYVVKPFSVRELLLRIRALLRRNSVSSAPRDEVSDLASGPLRIDLEGHRVWAYDQEITLTALEFKLLTTLLSRRGRVQSRERLLEDIWNVQADLTTRTVDTHVKRLRQKLGRAGECIETLRGVGYRFADRAGEA